MAWIFLFAAGICEILWAILLKLHGFRWSLPSLVMVLLMLLSFWLLQMAMKTLPLGTSYAIWTGVGAAGTAIYGMTFLREPRSAAQILCISFIICGIVGLRLLGSSTTAQ